MSKGSPVSVTKTVSYLRAMSGAKNQHHSHGQMPQTATLCFGIGFAHRPARMLRTPHLGLTNKIQSMSRNQIADTSTNLLGHIQLVQYFIHQATNL